METALVYTGMMGLALLKQHLTCVITTKAHLLLRSTAFALEVHLALRFLNVLKPTIMVLSETTLLKRCALGATQKHNKSWHRCPKTQAPWVHVGMLSQKSLYLLTQK